MSGRRHRRQLQWREGRRVSLLAFAVRTLACEVDRVLLWNASRKPAREAMTTAEDWRQVARGCLLVASWAEHCARELDGADDSDRAPTAWFRAVRSAWRDAPDVVARSLMPGAVVDWKPTEPPEVNHG